MSENDDYVTAAQWASVHGVRDIRQDGRVVSPDSVLLSNKTWVSRDEAVKIMREHHDRRVTELRNTVRAHKASIRAADAELRDMHRAIAELHAGFAKLDNADSPAVRDAAYRLIAAVTVRDQLLGQIAGTRALLEVAEEELAATSKDN
jgi:hypothetical protein